MSDLFVFRLLLVVVVIVILFALVSQYSRNSSRADGSAHSPTRDAVGGGGGGALSSDPYATQPEHPAAWERFDATSDGYTAHEAQQVLEQQQYAGELKQSSRLDVEGPQEPSFQAHHPAAKPSKAAHPARVSQPAPFENVDTEMYRAVDYKPEANKQHHDDYFPQDRTTTEDLLPGKDAANSKWAQVNPAGQGDLMNVSLLNAGFHMGTNTQAQTMRNPNLQLRSEYPNPKAEVGPWNSSTIESDHDRRYFELGEP